jgi:hypothetical protein
VNKTIADQEIIQGNLRRDLHEILRKAEVDEISLPVNTLPETEVADRYLKWEGAATQSENESTADHSLRFSQSQNFETLQGMINIVDLSSVKSAQKTMKRRKETQADREKRLTAEMKELSNELDSMKPNMHALERHEIAREKCRECESEYDDASRAVDKASKE